MDLGIAGRKAIPGASSCELGRACATALAQAGYITGQNLLIDGGIFPGAF